MKKLFIAAAVATFALSSCGNASAPKATFNNEIDTLSYAMGYSNSEGLLEFANSRFGVDSTLVDEFMKGLLEGANSKPDAKKKEFAFIEGYKIGEQLRDQINHVSKDIFQADSTKSLNKANFIAGFYNGALKKDTSLTYDSAYMLAKTKSERIKDENSAKAFAKEIEEGKAFLEENKTKEGVVTTESGLQYIVLNEGKGKTPEATSTVKVNYVGTLLDGTEFDSSYSRNEPAQFQVNGVIAGWTEALQLMKEGGKMRLFIPSELAYGSRGAGEKIKPYSTLVFEVELLEVVSDKK